MYCTRCMFVYPLKQALNGSQNTALANTYNLFCVRCQFFSIFQNIILFSHSSTASVVVLLWVSASSIHFILFPISFGWNSILVRLAWFLVILFSFSVHLFSTGVYFYFSSTSLDVSLVVIGPVKQFWCFAHTFAVKMYSSVSCISLVALFHTLFAMRENAWKKTTTKQNMTERERKKVIDISMFISRFMCILLAFPLLWFFCRFFFLPPRHIFLSFSYSIFIIGFDYNLKLAKRKEKKVP